MQHRAHRRHVIHSNSYSYNISDTHIFLLLVIVFHRRCILLSLEGLWETFYLRKNKAYLLVESVQWKERGHGLHSQLCNLLLCGWSWAILLIFTKPQFSYLEKWNHKGAVGASWTDVNLKHSAQGLEQADCGELWLTQKLWSPTAWFQNPLLPFSGSANYL